MSSFFPWQKGEQQWKQRKDRQSFILDTKCRICTAPTSFALSGSGETRRERDIVAKEKSSASMSTKMQKEVWLFTAPGNSDSRGNYWAALRKLDYQPIRLANTRCTLVWSKLHCEETELHFFVLSVDCAFETVNVLFIATYARIKSSRPKSTDILGSKSYITKGRWFELYTPSSHWSSIRPSQPAMASLPKLQLDLKNQESLWSPHTYPKKNTLNIILPRHTTSN